MIAFPLAFCLAFVIGIELSINNMLYALFGGFCMLPLAYSLGWYLDSMQHNIPPPQFVLRHPRITKFVALMLFIPAAAEGYCLEFIHPVLVLIAIVVAQFALLFVVFLSQHPAMASRPGRRANPAADDTGQQPDVK